MRRGYDCRFGPFRLDTRNERLWRDADELVLRPKTFAVLAYLVEHAGDLVSKDELLQAVWPGVAVSDAVLTVCVGEIRRTLGDDSRAARYIETLHRRGYRFIGAVAPPRGRDAGPALDPPPPIALAAAGPVAAAVRPGSAPIVGRQAELEHLERGLERARGGARAVVFVTGDAGIGKTSLVNAFLDRVSLAGETWCGRGQCIAHYGAGEAYLPVLDALSRLAREFGRGPLKACLARYAPSWLLQLPALLDGAAELETLQRLSVDIGRRRMLRELAEALEALTAERPLILVLEDLHWSDYATVDLIAWLAQRQEPARLLLLGTYRPVEVIVRDHPLQAVKQELTRHGRCEELALELLTAAEVGQHLAARFGPGPLPAPLHDLARSLYRSTDGHPLFLVTLVDALVREGWLVEREGQWVARPGIETAAQQIPRSLGDLVEQQFRQLGAEDQRLLEAASVVGLEGSAAAVAAGLGEEVTTIEERCAALARRAQFLEAGGGEEWPDGTVAQRYRFRHTLYRQVVYDRLPIGRRAELHARIGVRQERGYGPQAAEHAAELATHFEQGRAYERALRYGRQAADNAMRRYAYREAIGHLRRGLGLLPRLAETPERTREELDLYLAYGRALSAVHGPAASAVGDAYARAQALAEQVGEAPKHLAVLQGLRRHHLGRAQVQRARELGEEALQVAERLADPGLLRKSHAALGTCLLYLGELAAARAHLERGIADHDPEPPSSRATIYGLDADTLCHTSAGMVLWLLGYPDQALGHIAKALTLDRELRAPLVRVSVLCHAGVVHQFRRDVAMVQERAEAAMRLAAEHGFALWAAHATILSGWALAMQGQAAEGIARIVRGLEAWRTNEQQAGQPYFLALLAEAYGQAGQPENGIGAVAQALAAVESHGLRMYESELYRLKGDLLALTASRGDAEACLRRAIDIARHQGAKSFELRAAVSLARLRQGHGQRDSARRWLAEVYDWFTEGFETVDLREARALLD